MTDTLLALSTDHCRITPLFADDARALAAITDATVTSRVHFLPAPFTEADARALIAKSGGGDVFHAVRSEEHTSELQSLMRISYAVFCLNKKKKTHIHKDT